MKLIRRLNVMLDGCVDRGERPSRDEYAALLRALIRVEQVMAMDERHSNMMGTLRSIDQTLEWLEGDLEEPRAEQISVWTCGNSHQGRK